MLVCLYALRGFTRPSYISGGGGGIHGFVFKRKRKYMGRLMPAREGMQLHTEVYI